MIYFQVKKNSNSKNNAPESDTTSGSFNEISGHEMTTFANLSLEKQYENVFGQFSSLGVNNNSLNDSKKGRRHQYLIVITTKKV